MGMFDHYRPMPNLACPVCGVSSLDWQGKDGPCGLFVWEQGHMAPVDQFVDEECKISVEARSQRRLPNRFEIYTNCQCSTFLQAVGFTENDVWNRTELLNSHNAVPYRDESEGEFEQRLVVLAKHPGHEH